VERGRGSSKLQIHIYGMYINMYKSVERIKVSLQFHKYLISLKAHWIFVDVVFAAVICILFHILIYKVGVAVVVLCVCVV